MRSDIGPRERRRERYLLQMAHEDTRLVDLGVELKVVVADPNGEQLIYGKPNLRIVDTHKVGGRYDKVLRRFVGEPLHYLQMFASVMQAQIALHKDGDPLGQLIYGSEGGGKTEGLVLWHLFRILEHIGEGREGGQVAPTYARLEGFIEAWRARVPADWYHYFAVKRVLRFIDGSRIRMVSTHRSSDAVGSPIQGYGWSWAGMDEAQDSIKRFGDVESRGRSARMKNGVSMYKQARTATAKDNTDWRNARDQLLASGLWVKRTLRATDSPFVPASFWEQKKSTMSKREYQRRVLAEDVLPELATYPAFNRDKHLRPRPNIGATDVTARELSPWGQNHQILIGYDPGRLFDVSVFLKAYKFPNVSDPVWWVVDEVTTEQSTTQQHVDEVIKRLRSRWELYKVDFRGRLSDGTPTALIRADPSGNRENDTEHPDATVYTVFRQSGLQILAAAYTGTPGRARVGNVPLEAGIDMVNTLLCSQSGNVRLYIDCDDRRQAAAPNLLKSLESSERNAAGMAERDKKDKNDPSHWPAALRYALWSIEKPRLSLVSPSGTTRSVR